MGLANHGINWVVDNRVHQGRGFHSNHVGGAHFAFCDGSARFVSENIHYNTETYAGNSPPNGGWIDSTFERLVGKSDGQTIGEY